MQDTDFTIVTDSATDMPKWIIDEYNLHVIPTPVVINEEDFFDGETIMPKDFYDVLRSGTNVTTYHINEFMFYKNFEPYAKRGERVLYFCFSTGIAGTFGAANLAKKDLLEKYPDFELHIMDSRCAAIGFGSCVYMALQMQRKGASLGEVMEAARFHFDHMEHIFTVETLEYLYKGGRLSKTAAVAGGILDIKPIIEVTDEGKLAVCEKVRGRQRSINRIVDIIAERAENISEQTVAIVHADCPEIMKEVEQLLTEKYGVTKFIEAFLGCAIGAHTGPGLVGICALNAESPYKRYFE